MADSENKAYPLGMSAAEAAAAINFARASSLMTGLLSSDGRGNPRQTAPGTDYGWPVLMGAGPPTSATAASLSQHYYDLTATQEPFEWICTGATSRGYVWHPVATGGAGFQVKGYFLTLEALTDAITEAAPGDAYGVGTAPPYDIYVFDGHTSEWLNTGPISGSPGVGVPPHGSIGQALFKSGTDNYATEWGSIAVIGGTPPTAATTAAFDGQLYVVPSGGNNASVWVCASADKVSGNFDWRPLLNALDIPAGYITTNLIAPGAIGRTKLAADALYSPVEFLNASTTYSIDKDDTGKTLVVNIAGDVVITLSQAVSLAMNGRDEIAIVWFTAGSIKIVPDGVRFAVCGEKSLIQTPIRLTEKYDVISMKRIAGDTTYGDIWLVTGNLEVVL